MGGNCSSEKSTETKSATDEQKPVAAVSEEEAAPAEPESVEPAPAERSGVLLSSDLEIRGR